MQIKRPSFGENKYRVQDNDDEEEQVVEGTGENCKIINSH